MRDSARKIKMPLKEIKTIAYSDREESRDSKVSGNVKSSLVGEEDILVSFSNDTTLHGLRNACRRGTHIFRRGLWIFVIIGMTIGCVVMITQSTIKYLKFESVTSTIKLLNNTLHMPSVTVCNMNLYKLSVITQQYPEVFRYNMLLNQQIVVPLTTAEQLEVATLTGVLQTLNLETFMFDTSSTPQDMFVNCYVRYVTSSNATCWDYMTPLVTDKGVCQTFNSQSFIDRNGELKIFQPGSTYGVTMTLDVKKDDYYFPLGLGYGMLVFIHDPKVYPMMEQQAFVVSPGQETYVGLQKYITKRLPRPYSLVNCIDNDLKEFKDYSREFCMRKCIAHEMYERRCIYPTTCNVLDAYRAGARLAIMGEVAKNCSCRPTCSETTYQYKVTSTEFPNPQGAFEALERNWPTNNATYIKENYAHLKIYFDTMEYVTNEQLPAMTVSQIVADIGGQLGICLGASLITLAEFFDYGIVAAHVFYVKVSNKRVNKKNEVTMLTGD